MRTAPRIDAVFHASAEGANHRARGTGNEDAVAAAITADGAFIAAVADGHSDPRCVRARRGADLAVQAVIGTQTAPDGRIGRAVVELWRRAVDEDRRIDVADGVLPRLAYGTTLLACRCDEHGIALLQIGDGDVVVVDRAGTAVRPLEHDRPDLPLGGTHSLADEDVVDELIEGLLPRDATPAIVLLTSDGIDNAYPSATALLAAAEDLARRMAEAGTSRLQLDVERWVARAAEASGDDASAVVLVLPDGSTS